MIAGRKRNWKAVISLALTGTLILPACATYTPALVRLAPSGPGTRKVAQASLAVQAEEFVTKEKSEKAFDTNMAGEGVLPILISIENTGSKPFDVNVADIRLLGEKPLKQLVPEDAAVKAQRGTGGRALGWSVIVPIITIPFAIFGSAVHTANVNQQILRDFVAKSLSDGAVLPNKERSGFVFFEADAGRDNVAGLTLQVAVRDAETGEITAVNLPLSQR